MKTTFYGLVMAAAVLFFSGCEKDTLQNTSATRTLNGKKPVITSSSEKSGQIVITADSSWSCGARICGAHEVVSTSQQNMLVINDNHSTAIRYAIYEVVSAGAPFEVANLLTNYTCTDNPMRYAGGLLNNGAKIMVYAMHTGDTAPVSIILNSGAIFSPVQISQSDYKFVIMGNHEGLGCGGDPHG